MIFRTMHPVERTTRRIGAGQQTPHFRTYNRRALFHISPKLCVMVELFEPILKGADHFSTQFIVFPLGAKC